MKLTTNTIKSIIQHTLPVDMTYAKARSVKDPDGQLAQRAMGISKDKLFTVELIGHPKKLTRLVFMSLYEPTVLGRNLKPINKIISKEIKGWPEQWLLDKMAVLSDNQDERNGRVRVRKVQFSPDATAVFIEVQ